MKISLLLIYVFIFSASFLKAQYTIEQFTIENLNVRVEKSCVGPERSIYTYSVNGTDLGITKISGTGDLLWQQNYEGILLDEVSSVKINYDFESDRLYFQKANFIYVFNSDQEYIESVDISDVGANYYLGVHNEKAVFYHKEDEIVNDEYNIRLFGFLKDLNTMDIDTVYDETESFSDIALLYIYSRIYDISQGYALNLEYVIQRGDMYEPETSFRSRVIGIDYQWNINQDFSVEYDDIPGIESDFTYLDLSYYHKLIKNRSINADWTEASIGECELPIALVRKFEPKEFLNGDLMYGNAIYNCSEKIMDLPDLGIPDISPTVNIQNLAYYVNHFPNSDTLYTIYENQLTYIYPDIDNNVSEITQNTELRTYPNPCVNVLNLKSNKNIKELSLYNIKGEKIQKKITYDQISLIDLKDGFYFLECLFEDGHVVRKKIIKQ